MKHEEKIAQLFIDSGAPAPPSNVNNWAEGQIFCYRRDLGAKALFLGAVKARSRGVEGLHVGVHFRLSRHPLLLPRQDCVGLFGRFELEGLNWRFKEGVFKLRWAWSVARVFESIDTMRMRRHSFKDTGKQQHKRRRKEIQDQSANWIEKEVPRARPNEKKPRSEQQECRIHNEPRAGAISGGGARKIQHDAQ